MKHFDALLPHMAPDGVLALDDISFSWDMWHAWTNISRGERVRVSVTLGRMGILAVD